MSDSAISKAIAKASGASTKTTDKDSLERQVEAAQFYGAIRADNEQQQVPRKRGRPPTKSKSPGPPPPPPSGPQEPEPPRAPGAQKTPTKEGINKIVEEMKKNSLIAKVRACAAWWPELCSETLRNTNIYLCSIEQLETICKGFEDTVMIQSEIVDIPRAFKETIAKIEPIAVGVGLANPEHAYLSHLRKLSGFGIALKRDPAVDRNVKLLSLRFLGKMPRSPFLNLLWSIVMVGLEVIKDNTMYEVIEESTTSNQGVYEGL